MPTLALLSSDPHTIYEWKKEAIASQVRAHVKRLEEAKQRERQDNFWKVLNWFLLITAIGSIALTVYTLGSAII